MTVAVRRPRASRFQIGSRRVGYGRARASKRHTDVATTHLFILVRREEITLSCRKPPPGRAAHRPGPRVDGRRPPRPR